VKCIPGFAATYRNTVCRWKMSSIFLGHALYRLDVSACQFMLSSVGQRSLHSVAHTVEQATYVKDGQTRNSKSSCIYRRKLTASYSDDASCPDMLLTVACVKRRLTEGMSESDALLRRWSERLADDFDIRTCLIDTVLQLHQPCSNARNLPEIMDPPFRRVRQKGSPFVLSTSVDNLHVKR